MTDDVLRIMDLHPEENTVRFEWPINTSLSHCLRLQWPTILLPLPLPFPSPSPPTPSTTTPPLPGLAIPPPTSLQISLHSQNTPDSPFAASLLSHTDYATLLQQWAKSVHVKYPRIQDSAR